MMRLPDRRAVEALKAEFPDGCSVVLDEMDDVQAPPPGTKGIVTHIDSMGTIHIRWENGSGLGAVPGVDRIHRAD